MLAPRVKIMAPPLKVIDNVNSNIWENKLQSKNYADLSIKNC